MEYALGKQLENIDEKLNWIVQALHDTGVKPTEVQEDEKSESGRSPKKGEGPKGKGQG